MQPPAAYAGEDVVRALLDTLERECSSYCLLGGYEDLPGRVESDIDFMVRREELHCLPRILKRLSNDIDYRLVQVLQHETTASYYILAKASPGEVRYLHPDSCSDYYRQKRRWLTAEEVLKGRRRHPNGFWVPSSADAFMYYLAKRVLKRSLQPKHAEQLSRLFAEDPTGCSELIAGNLPCSASETVIAAARSGDWHPVIESIAEISTLLLASAPSQPFASSLAEAKRIIKRWLHPTGICVAILGPDGSGKTSVIERYVPAMEPAFRRTAYFHLRPRLFRGSGAAQNPNTDPHRSPPRGFLVSTAKLIYLWADYFIGYFLRVRPMLVRSTLVVFDRYYHDLLIDTRRFRYGGPKWLARLIGRFIPMPDLMLVLDAPAGVLQARKPEVSMEESRRQAEAYRSAAQAAASRTRSVVIDADQSLDEVVHRCVNATLERLEGRTAERLFGSDSELYK